VHGDRPGQLGHHGEPAAVRERAVALDRGSGQRTQVDRGLAEHQRALPGLGGQQHVVAVLSVSPGDGQVQGGAARTNRIAPVRYCV
jgi:hypothetical protein